MKEDIYKGWTIWNDPPPIPIRICDWYATHESYDGAPDSLTRHMYLHAETREELIERIDTDGVWLVEELELDEAEQDVADLKAENERLRKALGQGVSLAAYDRIADLETEIERLKELLEEWIRIVEFGAHSGHVRDIQNITLAALKQEGE